MTGNGRPEHVPTEYLRRSVVLDTAPLVADLGDVHAAAGRFLGVLPQLDLAAFRPFLSTVPAGVASVVLGTARQGLSEAGWRCCDDRSLLHLTLGMAASRGDRELEAAGMAVVGDYLACARTVGETADPMPSAVPDARVQAVEAERRRQREADQRRRRRHDFVADEQIRAEIIDTLTNLRPEPDDYEDGESRRGAVRLAVRFDTIIGWISTQRTLRRWSS